MNLRQKLDKRFNQLRSASFNGFPQVLQDFWRFFDNEPILRTIGNNLSTKFPDMPERVRVFFEARISVEPSSVEESAAEAFEILRRVSIQALDGKLRGGLMASIYPTEFSVYVYGTNQPELDKNYLSTFKERYLEKFFFFIEEQLEDDEIVDKTDNSSTNLYFHAAVGAVQTGNQNVANVNQNIGQNFSEILKQLAILKNQFQSLPHEDRGEAIDIVDDLEKEIIKENPNRSKIRGFLTTTKDFAVKTGTELAASRLAKLLESQMGIKG